MLKMYVNTNKRWANLQFTVRYVHTNWAKSRHVFSVCGDAYLYLVYFIKYRLYYCSQWNIFITLVNCYQRLKVWKMYVNTSKRYASLQYTINDVYITFSMYSTYFNFLNKKNNTLSIPAKLHYSVFIIC